MTDGRKTYLRLLSYSKMYFGAFLLGIMGTMIGAAVDASFAWLIKPLIDKGLIAKDNAFIHWLPFILIFAFLIRSGGNFMSNYYMSWAGRSIVTQFRKDLFAHYMRLPASYLDSTTSGQLLSKLIFNVEQVAKASTTAIVTIVQESSFIIGLVVVMFINSWKLSLLFFCVAPLVAVISRISSRRMRKLSAHVQDSMSGITQMTEEGLDGYKVIRTFGAQEYEINKFNHLAEKNRDREMKTIATNSLATSAVQLVMAGLIAVTVYLATAKITNITAGTFASTITAMLGMLKPMRNLTNVNNIIQKGIAGAESLFEILDVPGEIDSGQQNFAKKSTGNIVFENVSFVYPGHEKTVLKNISFEIPAGKTIALVGKSGSGKSTLASLLPRFYDVTSGKIILDDKDIQAIKLSALREQMALVSQHVVLFNDTILNNIAYGSKNIVPTEKIKAAAIAAHAWEFIQELPQGLNSIVGQNGVTLSGGQRQRIAIARALLKDAPVLILDEATSALDTESEHAIKLALEKLLKDRTTLIIAHRLSTIQNADCILVMEDGNIVESGSHASLMASNGYYSRLNQTNKEYLNQEEST
jgi:subfamily B ATP-binding cassette protein MsbA